MKKFLCTLCHYLMAAIFFICWACLDSGKTLIFVIGMLISGAYLYILYLVKWEYKKGRRYY
jgi:hypothetical protein